LDKQAIPPPVAHILLGQDNIYRRKFVDRLTVRSGLHCFFMKPEMIAPVIMPAAPMAALFHAALLL
jgi:hypothetical protein